MTGELTEASSAARRPNRLPEDRFDRIQHTRRAGAHRINGRPRTFWIYAVAALVGTAICATAGILALQSIGSTGESRLLPTKTSSQTAATAKLDPNASVAVINGTAIDELAGGVDSVITKQKWGKVGFSGDAEKRDVKISAIFYSADADRAAAEGLAQKLGGLSSYKSSSYDSYQVKLVVLLGADYAGPGKDEAAKIVSGQSTAPDRSATTTEPPAGTGDEQTPAP